jgi:SAM-dependent methyltransferase
MRAEFAETRGVLDTIRIEGDRLRISGWVVSFGAGALAGFRLVWGKREMMEYELTLGLASPDVARVWQSLDEADRARFELSAPVAEANQRWASDALLTVTPLFRSGRPGVGWHRVLAPQVPLPPPAFMDRVGGFFLPVAFEFLDHQVYRAGLRESDDLLDVGCGTGRMAYALSYYLEPDARYEGFDVDRELIDWATGALTPKLPNFHFQHVDLYNLVYNPAGTLKAEAFAFPYESQSFDFVLLTSVFTHLMPNGVRRYVEEIRRVLRPGGRCLCTAFLIDDDSTARIAAGHSDQRLVHRLGEALVADTRIPERAVGLPEPLLRGWVDDVGLRHLATYQGSWCGRTGVTYQDLLVLERPDDTEEIPRERPKSQVTSTDTPPREGYLRRALSILFRRR